MPSTFARSTIRGSVCETAFRSPGRDPIVRVIDTRELPEAVRDELAAYGLSCAKPGITAGDLEEGLHHFAEFEASLRSGTWSPYRAPAAPKPSVLALAIERFEKAQRRRNPEVELHTVEQIMAQLDKFTTGEKIQLRRSADLAPHVAAVERDQGKAAPALDVMGKIWGPAQAAPAQEAAE